MKAPKTVYIAAALLAAFSTLTVQGCYRTEEPPDTRNDAQKTETEWFNSKARETQGNFDALSPEDKARAIKFSNGSEQNARTGFGFAKNSKPGDN